MKRMIVLAALLLAAPCVLRAQGWIEPIGPRGGVHKLRSEVTVHVEGHVARVEVRETFRNDGVGLAEGEYLYPLPGEAVFADFALRQGEQELRGETMDAAQARSVYEQIVRRARDPALLELVGHGLIRARVFPIAAGDTRDITLRYTQVLARSGDALQFRYAASRPGPAAVRTLADSVPLAFTLVADDGAQFLDPFSPTDRLDVSRSGGRLVVRPRSALRGDLQLFLPLAKGLVGTTVATHRPNGSEDGYFMLTLSPAKVRAESVPRDVAVVLDVSGSMAGGKIEQARQALHALLGTLGEHDRFRLIAFSNGVTTQAADWQPASPAAIVRARAWIDHLEPSGGTNIADALGEAFRLRSPSGRLPIVLFLTDGLPTVGVRDPERIAAEAESERGERRVFAFGVGYDVNTYLLDRLGSAGRGASQYVQPGENVESAVSTLASKIRHPVLTDLAIAGAPVELTDVYPQRLPDLFEGEDLVVFGRYHAAARDRRGVVALTGRRGGRAERFSTTADFPAHEEANAFIPRLWASRKLGVLTRTLRLEGANPEIEAEIRRTALRYGLLSEYTAYLVKEPEAQPVADSRLLPRPAPAAARSGAAAVGAAAVKSAESARRQREVSSVADLAAAEAVVHPDAAEAGAGRRLVAGRLFERVDGVWCDAAQRQGVRTVKVRAFGDAYFALLRRLPELRPYWEQLGRVRVAGERVAVEVGPDGAGRLDPAELDRIVREFRVPSP